MTTSVECHEVPPINPSLFIFPFLLAGNSKECLRQPIKAEHSHNKGA